MKKILTVAAAMLAVVFSLNAKEEQPSKHHDVEQFTKIVFEGAFEVIYEHTDGTPYVEITARKNVLDTYVPIVKDGALSFATTGTVLFRNVGITVKCCSNTLSEAIISGTSSLRSQNGFETEKLYLEMNGTGGLELNKVDAESIEMHVNGVGSGELLDIDVDDLKVLVAAAGGATVSGEAVNADIELDGVGGIDITKLKVQNLNSRLNGIGKISR